MQDAVRNAATRLPPTLAERLPAEAFTLHRLLGPGGRGGEFRHHAANPLALDVLVVDEASMLDLALATKVLEALPHGARLILLGDKDQLAAVEAGAVFAELCADPTLTPACVERIAGLTGISRERLVCPSAPRRTGITDSVVWLTENFRFASDSGIGRLAACINAGDSNAAIALLRSRDDPALAWLEDADTAPQAATRERVLDRLAPYVEALRANPDDRHALFSALNRFRVLCAQREGARGVVAMNALASAHVRRLVDDPRDPGGGSPWYVGRPVMVLANDYVQKLWNGDVGIALPVDEGGLAVHFPQGDGGYRAVPPFRLPAHETAFATTVHKAQGSEFDEVLLLLPAKPGRVVSRELLYTAVTRARAAVTIVAGEDAMAAGIASPTRRYSGLVARLASS
jgi:exodeoxyribonuclease V alpha subunit